jgi:hypothetical protein
MVSDATSGGEFREIKGILDARKAEIIFGKIVVKSTIWPFGDEGVPRVGLDDAV